MNLIKNIATFSSSLLVSLSAFGISADCEHYDAKAHIAFYFDGNYTNAVISNINDKNIEPIIIKCDTNEDNTILCNKHIKTGREVFLKYSTGMNADGEIFYRHYFFARNIEHLTEYKCVKKS